MWDTAMSARSSAISSGGEVAAVVAALGRAGHPGAVSSRRRSSLIDHGSQGDRSSGGWPPFSAHAVSHSLEPAPDVDAVDRQRAGHRVHRRREPGALLAVGAEREPSPDDREAQRKLAAVVVHGHERLVDEDAQPLAVVEKRAQRLGPARPVRQSGQFRFGGCEQLVDRLLRARRAPHRTPASGVREGERGRNAPAAHR